MRNDDERRPVAYMRSTSDSTQPCSTSMRSTRASCPTWSKPTLEKIGVYARASQAAHAGDRRSLRGPETPPSAAKPATAQPSPSPPRSRPRLNAVRSRSCSAILSGSTSLTRQARRRRIGATLSNAYLDAASAAVTGLGGHVAEETRRRPRWPSLAIRRHRKTTPSAPCAPRSPSSGRSPNSMPRNAGRRAPQLIARIGLQVRAVGGRRGRRKYSARPNVAARVPGGGRTGLHPHYCGRQRQTAGLFVAEIRGAHALKGVAAPETLYRIVRASRLRPPVRSKSADAARRTQGGAHPICSVGAGSARAQGEGQVALVVGEPGIGKSRLVEEFHARLAEMPHTWIEWSSSQLLQNTPLHPIAEWGRQRFGFDLPAEQRLADIENALHLVGLDAVAYAPLLAPMVDIPLPKERTANFAPEELRRRQLAAMTAWILAAARTQPVVLAFEDLHWVTRLRLIARTLADQGAQKPLLIIATTRPEFRPPWSVRSHHSVISLSPLDRAQVARMVGKLASRHALSKEVIEGVSERTGGVPLFVEEVTRRHRQVE